MIFRWNSNADVDDCETFRCEKRIALYSRSLSKLKKKKKERKALMFQSME